MNFFLTESRNFLQFLNSHDQSRLLEYFAPEASFHGVTGDHTVLQQQIEKFYDRHIFAFLHVEDSSLTLRETTSDENQIVDFPFIFFHLKYNEKDRKDKLPIEKDQNEFFSRGTGFIRWENKKVKEFEISFDEEQQPISIRERRKLKKHSIKFQKKKKKKIERKQSLIEVGEKWKRGEDQITPEERERIRQIKQQKYENIHKKTNIKKERKSRLNKLDEQLHQQEQEFIEQQKTEEKEDWIMARVCIDLSFLHMMDNFACGSIRNQLAAIYQANLVSVKPFHVYYSCDKSAERPFQNLFDKLSGVTDWAAISFHPGSTVQQVLPSVLHVPIVYLSPDAEEPLLTVDTKHLYVIGGLCDRGRDRNITLTKCKEEEIVCKRLPIKETFAFNGNTILTISAVFSILQSYLEHGDWARCFASLLPKHSIKQSPLASVKESLDANK